jgi:glycosyltransferase involved in cell wall biosynthesis
LTDVVINVQGTDELLAQAYKGAAALIYPSIWEGFGMPPLEALAAGTTVISSNADSLSEILAKEDVYFFDPHSAKDLAERMKFVVSLGENYKKINSQELMRDEYSWERCLRETLNLYESLL